MKVAIWAVLLAEVRQARYAYCQYCGRRALTLWWGLPTPAARARYTGKRLCYLCIDMFWLES
jgi:hypothetical protein